jgi:hypothetical protein
MIMPIFDIHNVTGIKEYRHKERFSVEVEYDVDPVNDFQIIKIMDGDTDITELFQNESDIHQAIFEHIDEYDRPDPDDKYDERYDY